MGSNDRYQSKSCLSFYKSFLPHMIQRNSGVIVNVNSGAAKTGLAIYHLIVQASLGF